MTYSRRQLYAFGETLGDSVTRKIAGRVIYGGGGGNPLSAATDLVSDTVGGVADAVGDVAGGVGDAVGDVVSGAGDVANDFVGGIGSTVGGISGGISDAVGDAGQGVGDVLGDIVQGVGDLGQDAVDVVKDAGSSIDDAVNDIIPGGWTTVLSVAAGMYGIPIELITAAGATKGSGVLEGKDFNLEGAIRGGASAYGAGELGAYGGEQLGAESATAGAGADTGATTSPVQTPTPVEGTPLPPIGETMTSSPTATQSAGLGSLPTDVGPSPTPQGELSPVVPQNAGSSQVYPVDRMGLGSALPPSETAELVPGTASMDGAPVYDLSGPAAPMVESGTTGGNLLDAAGATVKNAAGAMGLDSLAGVAKGAAYAGLGLTALQALSAKNAQDKSSGAITDQQYLKNQAEIDKAIASAKEAVSMNPYQKDTAGAGLGRTLYQNNRTINQAGIKTLAAGGSIDQYETPDTLMAGGITNAFHFAHGGMANEPRFLSGGGDGMSDSIKANIDGHTEARLADGEFVVPADVVSHLGNGSSKAGAKQLYDMMDRIRKARTGNPKQGKQINPHKFLPK